MGPPFKGARLVFCYDGLRMPWANDGGNGPQVMRPVNDVDKCIIVQINESWILHDDDAGRC